MTELILASGNRGKLRELKQMLSPLNVELTAQSDYEVVEAEETGLSFVENAIIKARNACQQTGKPAIADDSGIEVDALHGAPGIYSARYGGADSSDLDKMHKLLQDMKDVPESERTARFQCVIVYMRHANDPTPLICQGTWHGHVMTQIDGDEGFGYDPIFLVAETGCSAARLSTEQKHALSHRGQALRQFIDEFRYIRHY